jgi:oligopeptidase B
VETLIPPRHEVMLEGFTLFTDWLVVEERQRGLTSLRQINRKTREVVGIAFDDPAYVTWLAYNPEPETSRLRYGYSSMTTPDTLFELDMDTGERRVLKQQEVKGFDASHYRSEHLWITARDGVEVPVSLVYHREHFRKGATRCWCTATAPMAKHGCRFQRQPAEPARPRLCVRHRPYSRRRRAGPAVV